MLRKLVVLLLMLGIFVVPTFAQDDEYPDWDVVLVGHRGLSPGFPENTMAAFRNSIELGVDVIELDLRGTSDGEVVILHDSTVDRTTDGTGTVTEMTLEEVRALDAGSYVSPEFAGERIPTYEEVLELVQGTGVMLLLDIKISPVLDKERIIRLTEEYDAVMDVIVGVRSVEDLREFRALNPNVRTLGFIPGIMSIDEFADAGIDIIRLWPRWINADQRLVSYVQDVRGLPVWSTANDAPREELDLLIRQGVNGILTDLPEVMAQLLADIDA
ncbi:MAG: hypothetical protein GYB67_17760 [Chloroflexi bacterium]|nr:hypothetical protein [Chloroflexota bacterium]